MTETHHPITDAERQRWWELCEKATPGPWHYDLSNMDVFTTHRETILGNIPRRDGDGKFIAKARTALPRLLEENQVLREFIQARIETFENLSKPQGDGIAFDSYSLGWWEAHRDIALEARQALGLEP